MLAQNMTTPKTHILKSVKTTPSQQRILVPDGKQVRDANKVPMQPLAISSEMILARTHAKMNEAILPEPTPRSFTNFRKGPSSDRPAKSKTHVLRGSQEGLLSVI